MSERNIDISPFQVRYNLIDLNAEIKPDGIDEVFRIPDSNRLNIHNLELPNGQIYSPRKDSKFVRIRISPRWLTEKSKFELSNLSKQGENFEYVFLLRIRIVCERTFWASKSETVKISEVGKKDVEFVIDLTDVQGQLKIETYITRETQVPIDFELKAVSALSIVSRNDEQLIQIDELEEIGRNYLPIEPKAINDLVFKMSAGDQYSMPVINYSIDFEKAFKRDDLFTVNTAFLMIMPSLLDHYLKWLLFKAQGNSQDKEQRSLVEKLSKLCGISIDDFYELMEKHPTEKVARYLPLSMQLFESIQTKAGINYKSLLDKYITWEKKVKG